ncbi:hypothetical protein ACQ4M3_07350 [Leptolyngbya sp. AN03gr2]|uniref:hypothetical protein n=1 Tax=unclassified Leptolyngbya TaxID=2650499 RepID=UPI003D32273C
MSSTLDFSFIPTNNKKAVPDTVQVIEGLLDYLESDASGDFACHVVPRIVAGYFLLAHLTHKSFIEVCQIRQGFSNPHPPLLIPSTKTASSEWTWISKTVETLQSLGTTAVTIETEANPQAWLIKVCSLAHAFEYSISTSEADEEIIDAIAEVFRLVLEAHTIKTSVSFNHDWVTPH